MQKPKLVDNATENLEFQDSSTQLALDGTILRAAFQNDNFSNLFKLVEAAGYSLIDNDISQITKAVRGKYVDNFIYNTSSLGTQTVSDVVLGSDGYYYECLEDGISGVNPVGDLTGKWRIFDNNTDIFSKPNYGALFIKTAPATIKIPLGFKVAVNNKIITLMSDYSLSLNTNLDTGIKTAGKDYYVYAKSDGTFYISANNALVTDKLIGGFHYGLTGETETRPAAALKTEADMVVNRGIKAYSMWDLTWKPANKRPEGKVLVNNLFWRDIYPADENYAIRGYSSCFALDGVTSAKIAGGVETSGRKFPKVPVSKGGDGTINYGSLTWYEANEIISEVGMRMISYDEFSNSSYGIVEQKSLNELGYTIGTGVIKHYAELESKWGVEMAAGVQWSWTKELMNGYGTTDFLERTGLTDTRGYIHATSNSPVAALAGGQEQHTSTAPVGSRALALNHYVWLSAWFTGFVAVCDHVNLDK